MAQDMSASSVAAAGSARKGSPAHWLLPISFFLGTLLPRAVASDERDQPRIDWQPWSDSVFEKARKEKRFVLLDLGAVWCHWCHVMEEITYRDPKVVALINSRYIAVRVDQDSRPDLSNR